MSGWDALRIYFGCAKRRRASASCSLCRLCLLFTSGSHGIDHASDYAVKRVLGEGAFARALLVANRKTGRVCCVACSAVCANCALRYVSSFCRVWMLCWRARVVSSSLTTTNRTKTHKRRGLIFKRSAPQLFTCKQLQAVDELSLDEIDLLIAVSGDDTTTPFLCRYFDRFTIEREQYESRADKHMYWCESVSPLCSFLACAPCLLLCLPCALYCRLMIASCASTSTARISRRTLRDTSSVCL